MYIKNIANPELIEDVQERLRKIEIERILTANELEELLSPSKITLFPVTHYTGRPDFAAECLLNGRFILIVDGNPSAIIGPVNLFLLLKSPEDASFPFLPVNVGRMPLSWPDDHRIPAWLLYCADILSYGSDPLSSSRNDLGWTHGTSDGIGNGDVSHYAADGAVP